LDRVREKFQQTAGTKFWYVINEIMDMVLKNFLKEFPDKQWSCSALDQLVQKIDSTGSLPFPFPRERGVKGKE